MERKLHNDEVFDFLQEELADFELMPDDNMWDAIQPKITPSNDPTPIIGVTKLGKTAILGTNSMLLSYKWWTAAASLLMLSFIGYWFFYPQTSLTNQKLVAGEVVEKKGFSTMITNNIDGSEQEDLKNKMEADIVFETDSQKALREEEERCEQTQIGTETSTNIAAMVNAPRSGGATTSNQKMEAALAKKQMNRKDDVQDKSGFTINSNETIVGTKMRNTPIQQKEDQGSNLIGQRGVDKHTGKLSSTTNQTVIGIATEQRQQTRVGDDVNQKANRINTKDIVSRDKATNNQQKKSKNKPSKLVQPSTVSPSGLNLLSGRFAKQLAIDSETVSMLQQIKSRPSLAKIDMPTLNKSPKTLTISTLGGYDHYFSNISEYGEPDNEEKEWHATSGGYSVGLIANYAIHPKWHIQTGVTYQHIGYSNYQVATFLESKGTDSIGQAALSLTTPFNNYELNATVDHFTPFQNGDTISFGFDINQSLHYLAIPLRVEREFGKANGKWKYNLSSGVALHYLLQNRLTLNQYQTTDLSLENFQFISRDIKNTYWSHSSLVGAERKLNDTWAVALKARFNYSITPISNSIEDKNIKQIGIQVGMKKQF